MGVQVLIKLVENVELNFGELAATRNMTVKLLRGLDFSRFSKGTLLVRLEAVAIPTGTTVDVNVVPSWPSPAQPEVSYESTAVGATVQLTNTSAAGKVYAGLITAQSGPALDLHVKGTQGASSPSTFTVAISVGLLAYE